MSIKDMFDCCAAGQGGKSGQSSPGTLSSSGLGPAYASKVLKQVLPWQQDEEAEKLKRRSCTLMNIGSDARVTMIPWIFFSLTLFYFGLKSPLLLQILAVVYGFIVSTLFLHFSIPRNWRWIWYSVFCYVSCGLGLVIGLLVSGQTPADDPLIVTASQIWQCIGYSAIFLLLMFFFGWLLPKTGYRLVGSSAEYAEKYGWGWNGRVAQEMLFGCERSGSGVELADDKIFPRWMAVCLVWQERHYWSGEPALDYMFELANTHTLLGCFLCHPVNPYEKMERVAVIFILVPLIIFPCALANHFIEGDLVRMIVVAICATLPRKILEAVLKRICLVADKEDLGLKMTKEEEDFMKEGEPTGSRGRLWTTKNTRRMLKKGNAMRNEIIFMVLCGLGVTILGVITCFIIAEAGDPLWYSIVQASVGLDFAVLLELCFRMILPHLDQDRIPRLGFFGMWYAQRKYYTPDTYVKNHGGIFDSGLF